MSHVYSIPILLVFASAVCADISMSGPKTAKNTAEIVASAEKDDVQGGLRSKARVSTLEFRAPEQNTFVAWYSPYSGRAACHIYVYAYDETRKLWIRKIARVLDGTPRVSVECGDVVTVRDAQGKAILQYGGA